MFVKDEIEVLQEQIQRLPVIEDWNGDNQWLARPHQYVRWRLR
jgi:hypothetical protein